MICGCQKVLGLWIGRVVAWSCGALDYFCGRVSSEVLSRRGVLPWGVGALAGVRWPAGPAFSEFVPKSWIGIFPRS